MSALAFEASKLRLGNLQEISKREERDVVTGMLTTIKVGTPAPLKSGRGTLRQGVHAECPSLLQDNIFRTTEGTHVVSPALSSKETRILKVIFPKTPHIKKLSQSGAHVTCIITNISAVGQVRGAVALHFF